MKISFALSFLPFLFASQPEEVAEVAALEKAANVVTPGWFSSNLTTSADYSQLAPVWDLDNPLLYSLISTTPLVVIPSTLNPELNPEFVNLNVESCALLQDKVYNEFLVTGNLAITTIPILTSNGTTIFDRRVRFLLTDSSLISNVIVGFGFSDCYNFNIVDQLYSQAYLKKRVMSISLPADGTNGLVTFGTYDTTQFTTLQCYPALPAEITKTDAWTLPLSYIAVYQNAVTRRRCNSVAINTNSQYHLLPISVFYTLLNFLGLACDDVTVKGNIVVVDKLLNPAEIAKLPDVTYMIDDTPLVLTSLQYTYPAGTHFRLAFAGSEELEKCKNAPYTLGNALFINKFVAFDYDNLVVSIGDRA